jgi:hypothetical protein
LLPRRVGFWQTGRMNSPADLDALSPDELRTLAAQLMAQAGENERELRYRQTRIDQLTHEIAMLRRLHFGKRSEQLNPEQMSLCVIRGSWTRVSREGGQVFRAKLDSRSAATRGFRFLL